jgi:TrmH family RNA methyltransferase
VVIQPLDSLENKTLRQVRRLQSSRTARQKGAETLVEGPHLIEEALALGLVPRLVVYSPKWIRDQHNRSFLVRLQAASARLFYVTDRIMDEISQVETPQGILAVISTPPPLSLEELMGAAVAPLLLPVAVGIQDPGNLGTLMRAALASGAQAFGLTSGTVDPFNPKCLRASAGAAFRLSVILLKDDWPAQLRDWGVRIWATQVDRGIPYYEADWTGACAVILGNEGNGLDDQWRDYPDVVTIPMSPAAESLNVSMAGAILLFHAAYQRQKAGIGFFPPAMV